MKEPIFFVEPFDVGVFETVSSAELYLEPDDARDREFLIFDAEGKLLDSIIKLNPKGIEYVSIVDRDQGQDPHQLTLALRRYLQVAKHDPNRLAKMKLPELVAESTKYFIV